jgi:hypothetical protein
MMFTDTLTFTDVAREAIAATLRAGELTKMARNAEQMGWVPGNDVAAFLAAGLRLEWGTMSGPGLEGALVHRAYAEIDWLAIANHMLGLYKAQWWGAATPPPCPQCTVQSGPPHERHA